jgi:hypothetical protein
MAHAIFILPSELLPLLIMDMLPRYYDVSHTAYNRKVVHRLDIRLSVSLQRVCQ